jgi:hypothetical protein
VVWLRTKQATHHHGLAHQEVWAETEVVTRLNHHGLHLGQAQDGARGLPSRDRHKEQQADQAAIDRRPGILKQQKKEAD